MAGIPILRTPILPEWIDYNGHLRDAYYGLIFSQATDALMDRIGLDAGYRASTGCTLYTVEMHLHYLQEVKAEDTAEVTLRILATDAKRIHLALELVRAGKEGVAAGAEVMLLHVQQHGGTVSTAVFPAAVSAALATLRDQSASLAAAAPGSRRMELRAAARPS
ncbi:MAG: thioesterase family protein [Proteobacteria bacterium]|nr:thioesterase family protein [Pseudomonadota bacterium]